MGYGAASQDYSVLYCACKLISVIHCGVNILAWLHINVLFYLFQQTAIRSLMRFGDEAPKKYDLSSLKVLGTVGEPINPAAWKWYFDVIGKGQCAVVDTYWQVRMSRACFVG